MTQGAGCSLCLLELQVTRVPQTKKRVELAALDIKLNSQRLVIKIKNTIKWTRQWEGEKTEWGRWGWERVMEGKWGQL